MNPLLILTLFGLLVTASSASVEDRLDETLYPINEENETIDIGDSASNIAVLKQRKYVATGYYNGARLFDLVSKQLVRNLDRSTAYDLLPLGDNKLIQASSYGEIKIWDVDTGKVVKTLQGHSEREVRSLALNKNQNLLLSGGKDKNMALWDLAGTQSQPIRIFEGHTDVVSSVLFYESSGQVISGSEDSTIRVWNQYDGALVREMKGHTFYITKLVLDEKAGRLYSASGDFTIKEWNISNGALMRTYSGHTTGVHDLMMTEDGQRLVSSSRDQSVIIWDKSSGQLISRHIYPGVGLYKVAVNPLNGQLLTTSSGQKLVFWPLKP